MDTLQPGTYDHERLDRLLNVARARQRITWDDVARRGEISVALLRNIRKGRAPITLDSQIAVERGLKLPEGWVRRAATGEDASPDEVRSAPIELRDDNERRIWSMDAVDEELRLEYIHMYRARQSPSGATG